MSDITKELLDEDSFDPKKLFDKEEYNTLIIGREGFSKKDNNAADLIENLLDKEITRQESEAIFSKLKELNSVDLMVNSINAAQRIEEKISITAACWESCLDFTNHFLFFTELACHNDFLLAVEALTVVQNCEGNLDEQTLTKALEIAQNTNSKHHELINDLTSTIKSRIS
jgi:hypothetical protein